MWRMFFFTTTYMRQSICINLLVFVTLTGSCLSIKTLSLRPQACPLIMVPSFWSVFNSYMLPTYSDVLIFVYTTLSTLHQISSSIRWWQHFDSLFYHFSTTNYNSVGTRVHYDKYGCFQLIYGYICRLIFYTYFSIFFKEVCNWASRPWQHAQLQPNSHICKSSLQTRFHSYPNFRPHFIS